MKLNSLYKYIRVFFFISILVYIINSLYADDQLMQISSKYQSIDISTNTILFQENVILKYKQFELFANKIVIIHSKDTWHASIIKAYGDPLMLYHNRTSDSVAFLKALIAYYNISDNCITFDGNVCLEQFGNSIRSDNIVYLINQKKIQILSKKGEKIITILKINPVL